jgi:actin-related protein
MRFSGDYKTKFNDAVTELVAKKIADRGERMAAVDALINEYVRDTGEVPVGAQLERLTNTILMEELTDPSLYKVQNTEYPFLSERQFERRYDNEKNLEVADAKFRKPTRRPLAIWEQIKMDEQAKIRNKERREQYRKDTMTVDTLTFKSNREAIDQYLIETYGAHKLRYS